MTDVKTDWKANAPAGSWKECAYYVVKVRFNHNNPEHKAILYTGFLNGDGGTPGGYSCLFHPTYEGATESVDHLYFIAPVHEIAGMERGA